MHSLQRTAAGQFPSSPTTTQLQLLALSDSTLQPNNAAEQVQLALNPGELATIVIALHAIELHGFAERLNTVLRHVKPAP